MPAAQTRRLLSSQVSERALRAICHITSRAQAALLPYVVPASYASKTVKTPEPHTDELFIVSFFYFSLGSNLDTVVVRLLWAPLPLRRERLGFVDTYICEEPAPVVTPIHLSGVRVPIVRQGATTLWKMTGLDFMSLPSQSRSTLG